MSTGRGNNGGMSDGNKERDDEQLQSRGSNFGATMKEESNNGGGSDGSKGGGEGKSDGDGEDKGQGEEGESEE